MGTKRSVEMGAGLSPLREFGVDLGVERKAGPASILTLVIFLQPSRGLEAVTQMVLHFPKRQRPTSSLIFPKYQAPCHLWPPCGSGESRRLWQCPSHHLQPGALAFPASGFTAERLFLGPIRAECPSHPHSISMDKHSCSLPICHRPFSTPFSFSHP